MQRDIIDNGLLSEGVVRSLVAFLWKERRFAMKANNISNETLEHLNNGHATEKVEVPAQAIAA